MSDLNIKLNLETTAAQAGAATVQGELTKLKTDAEKPIKIKVDIDGLQESEQKSKDLKKNLEDLKSQALGELSQHAAQFAEHLGGVEGKVASIAIKSLSAFGPMGQQIGAVMGVVALAITAFDDYIKEQDLIAAKTNEITDANNNQAGAYPSLITAINGARTAEELHNNVLKEKLSINSQIAVLLQGGTGLEAAQAEITVLQQANRAHQDISVAMMETALHTGNAAVQQQALGFSFTHSTNAIREHIQVQDAVTVIQARNAVEAAAAARAANQHAVDNRRAAREALQDAAAEQDNAAGVSHATNQLRVAENEANAAFIQMNRTEAESNRLHDLGIAATGRLAGSTNTLTDAAAALNAQFSRDQINKNNARAHAAAAGAETALQRRAGEEALRVAEEGIITAGREVSAHSQTIRLQEALTFAISETTRARVASESHGQTAAERTALVSALNAEATARDAVATATQREATATIAVGDAARERVRIADQAEMARSIENKDTRADEAARGQAESNRAFGEWARNRNTINEQLNQRDAARAQQIKDRNNQLAGSAGKLAEAQLSSAMAAAFAGKNAGDAMQAALKASLEALSTEAAIKALYATATGLFQIATGNPAGVQTLVSAAMFAGVALAAGGASELIEDVATPPTAGATGGSAGGGGGGGGGGATPMRSGGSSAAEAPSNITINMNAFQSNDQAQALIVRSLREAGYRNIR